MTKEQRVGDVASFYLPYVEEAIEAAPDIRIICLQRPQEEVVAGLRHSLNQSSGISVNQAVARQRNLQFEAEGSAWRLASPRD